MTVKSEPDELNEGTNDEEWSTDDMPTDDLAFEEQVEFSYSWLKLTGDLKGSARMLNRQQARWLVDSYYQVQDVRKRARNQVKAAEKTGEPHDLLEWWFKMSDILENALRLALGEFAASYRAGQWLQSIHGIGPVLSAALLTSFDVRVAPNPSNFWRYAGCDPTFIWHGDKKATAIVAKVWPEGEKKVSEKTLHAAALESGWSVETLRKLLRHHDDNRSGLKKALSRCPYNKELKMICLGRMGDTIVKCRNNPKDFYGVYYDEHRASIEERNNRGEFEQYAKGRLENGNWNKGTEAYKAYAKGRLPNGQMYRRSVRWMVKLLISHLHYVMYDDLHGQPPERPYAFYTGDGRSSRHTHFIPPPGWPSQEFDGRGMEDLFKSNA